MKVPVSSSSGFSNGTDLVSFVASKNQNKVGSHEGQTDSLRQSASFLREIPIPRNAEYVEADGKKYLLNAPRGTYLNILV